MRTSMFLVHVLALLAIHASTSLSMRVAIRGRCPDLCSADVESVFFSCVNEIENGCALTRCDSPTGGVTCSLRSGVPEVLFTGERVTFRGFEVMRNFTTDIAIRGPSPRTDVYFLVDGTGSVGPAVTALRRSFNRLTNALGEKGDFAYGVGIFRDENELNMGFRNLQSISTNASRVRRSMRRIRSAGGGDTEEANLVALYKIATGDFANWREGAERIVLLFGDAVGHEPTCFDDVVLTRSVVAQALNDADITVQIIGTQSSALNAATSEFGCGGESAGRGQSNFITRRTGGSLNRLRDDSAGELFNVVFEVLGNNSTVVDIAESDCDDGLVTVFDPPLPRTVGRGERITATFTPRGTICESGSFICSFSFNSGRSVSQSLTLRFFNPVGCSS